MTTDNKTLADVQPGRRVRLGDQAERARFEAWASAEGLNAHIHSANGMYSHPVARGAWLAWQHLSAQPSPATCKEGLQVQPSPGGQDALLDQARKLFDELGAIADDDKCVAILADALAARQPVGEPVAWLIERLRGKGYGRDKYVVMKGQASSDPDSHLFWADQQARDNHRVTPLYAAPPAQAVDLGKVRQLIGDLRALGVKASTKNDNAGFVDLRCYWALLGLAGEIERSMADSQAVGK